MSLFLLLIIQETIQNYFQKRIELLNYKIKNRDLKINQINLGLLGEESRSLEDKLEFSKSFLKKGISNKSQIMDF